MKERSQQLFIKLFFYTIILSFSTLLSDTIITRAFSNLEFSNPIEIQSPSDGSNRIFVVSQNGVIYHFDNSESVSSASVFLDLQDKVLFGGEQGLLGLAFHPQFDSNGKFFVNYTITNPRRTVISQFTVFSTDENIADPESELVLLEYDQPFSNHNGGKIAFGPDGYLYISSGDGGSGGDPQNNAQNLGSLLGKILRIDVDQSEDGKNYGVPEDNPFKNSNDEFAKEIYAYGLRNAWKFSFDSSGRLWASDVGQNAWEEINLIINGGNYGWRIMEGFHCYNPSTNCDQNGLELPVWEYAHNSDGGYSITGGYVYEGSEVMEFIDNYIYADFVSGNIWAFNPIDFSNKFITSFSGGISTFGVDQNNVLYFADYYSGFIYKFTDDEVNSVNSQISPDFSLLQNYPNPFNPSTTIEYSIPSEVRGQRSDVKNVTLKVYDILGRELVTLVNEEQKPGNYKVKFDPSASGLSVNRRIASGIYMYKLDVGKLTVIKKMLLMK